MKIGIDLGTTNSALAWIDEREAEDASFPPVHIFETPQLVAPGRVEPRRTLPSFLFLEDGQPVGVYAREQGALVPTRLVHSREILALESRRRSHREDSALGFARNRTRALARRSLRALSRQVPRRVGPRQSRAAGRAGHRPHRSRLVRRRGARTDRDGRAATPASSASRCSKSPPRRSIRGSRNNLARSRKKLFDGQIVLVCDVGGGTSDFTLIRVSRDGDQVDFTRTAVGKHLLLGGDNLDLTLAWLVETKLDKQLSIRQRSGLRRQCSAAKEKLLSDPNLKSVEITVLGTGSSLIGKSLKTRNPARRGAGAGARRLPAVQPSAARSRRKKSAACSANWACPTFPIPPITRHLNAFLESAGETPDAILFNGGFFIPEILRERVADVVGNWYGKRPEIFENRDLDLAVARGAAYYSYVRSTGSGVLVRGGLPRAYYIGLGEAREGKLPPSAWCRAAPKKARRSKWIATICNWSPTGRSRSASTARCTRTEDKLGEVVEFAADDADLHMHAPLHAVIRFGKKAGERLVPVKLGARLTEIGTLETWCESKISDNRWRLQFALRKQAAQPPNAANAKPPRWSANRR